jgi:hypothetical protein
MNLKNNKQLGKKLIDAAIINRDSVYLNLISHVVNLTEFPVCALIGKYGLVNWINEIFKLDLNLFLPNENDNNKTFIDYIILSKKWD